MAKPKIGLYWCASCGGCEEAVVDLAEDILQVVAAVDIVFWPVAMDFKREDVEALADGELAVVFINGGIRNSEQVEMAELLRRKTKVLIAFGSCAHTGGIPGLANLNEKEAVLRRVYKEVPSVENSEGTRPQPDCRLNGHALGLPDFHSSVKTLDQVVDVDYTLPGCPPQPHTIMNAITAILKGKLPAKGAILAPDYALCKDCKLVDSKPEDLQVKEFKRPHQILIDPEKCLLAQGLLCLGPVTRAGCGAKDGALCVNAAMPCSGCYGPVDSTVDFGAKALSMTASIVEAEEAGGIDKVLDGVPDPTGTFYRYSLPASRLQRKRSTNGKKGE